MRRATTMLWLALSVIGCGRTAQDRESFPIHGAGTGEVTFESNGWSVTLVRADVGFGPVYFCATSSSDLDVCTQAEGEWRDAATVNALDPTPEMLGDADAVTSTVRSAMFDYGRSWHIGAPSPTPSPGAPDGRSAVLVARASRGEDTLEVRAAIDVHPRIAGGHVVIGAPTGTHAIAGSDALVVRMDPAAWWRRVDFDAVQALDEDGDGFVELAPGDGPYEALVIAMTAGRLPRFEWNQP
jgi:hypothetical protein